MLVPSTYHAVYISHDWGGSNFRKNLDPTVKQAFSCSKTLILLAGNLTVLQQFLREYPDCERFKVLLFDFPGVMVPFEDPLIEWLDCDHQAGGAWQTAKIKMERFATDLENLSPLSAQGKDLIGRMKRFCPRESRVSEIEAFTEMFAEGLPKDYRDLYPRPHRTWQKCKSQKLISTGSLRLSGKSFLRCSGNLMILI
jgi:hypothetical protein